MKVNIKAAGDRAFTVEVDAECTMEALGKKLAEEHNLSTDVARLVYRGRILKGPATQTLSSHNITDGSTIYVLKTASAATSDESKPSAGTAVNPSTTSAPSGPTNAAPFAGASGSPPNPFANLGTGNAGNPFAGLGGGLPGMDPGMLNSMLQNPMMQQMMSDMMSQPDFMRSVIESNPLLSNMAATNPMLNQALRDPTLMQQMMNPNVIAATQQMLSGQRPPPGTAPTTATAPAQTAPPTSSPAAPPTGSPPDFNALLSSLGGMGGFGGPAAASGNPAPQAPGAGSDFLSNMTRMMQDPAVQQQMNSLISAMGTGGPTGGLDALRGMGQPQGQSSSPEDQAARFEDQLKMLQDMGFPGRDANLNALIQSNGDVNVAINLLLERGFGN